jgi:translation initiation factor 4G
MTFKKCVITVCQNFFQKHCLDDTETLTMSVEHEQNQRRLKMQSIGCIRYKKKISILLKKEYNICVILVNLLFINNCTCRFIGEIFKQSLLSPNVVHYCVKTLVSRSREKSLEYLCNLLKIAGKELQEKVFFYN